MAYGGRHLTIGTHQRWDRELASRSHVCVCPPQPASSLDTHAYVQIDLSRITMHTSDNLCPHIQWNEHCEASDTQFPKRRHLDLSDRCSNPVCTFDLTKQEKGVQFIHFGFDNTQRPVCFIADASFYGSLTKQLSRFRCEKGSRIAIEWTQGLKELVLKMADGVPNQTNLRNVKVDYLYSLPWSRLSDRTLIPHESHLGCWAAIGNAGQDLHFTVESWKARDTRLRQRLGIFKVPRMDYTVNVAFVQNWCGSASTWQMNIDLWDSHVTKP